VVLMSCLACGAPAVEIAPDAASSDSGALDAGAVSDAGRPDSGAEDAGVPDAGPVDGGVTDAGSADGGATDAGVDDGGPTDAGVDAGGPTDAGAVDAGAPGSHPGWAEYTLVPGAHSALVALNGAPRLPLAGFSFVSARTYQFIFDPSAKYVLTNPAQPGDQLDWNKLPGLSDCGQLDLSQDGLMFAWRWRLDLTPNVLELAHYANNAGTHLSPAQGLVTLDEADLQAETPLTYELSIGGAANDRYLFHLHGTVRGRVIDVNAEHPRRCSSTAPTTFKWAAGFYFGGTSVAPTTITGWVLE
jgi:hypothetical protein